MKLKEKEENEGKDEKKTSQRKRSDIIFSLLSVPLPVFLPGHGLTSGIPAKKN